MGIVFCVIRGRLLSAKKYFVYFVMFEYTRCPLHESFFEGPLLVGQARLELRTITPSNITFNTSSGARDK